MSIDLHLHTTYSDGSFTPNELINKAIELNFSAIGITDHDTINGIEKILKLNLKSNLEIVPGIEFNTEINNYAVHILGYYIDYKNKELINILKKIKKERRERIKKMIELLKDLYGFNLTMKEIENISANNIIGRSHIARLLIEKGYISNWERVFNNYIGKGKAAYVKRNKISPFKAIDIIKKASGIPIIAHPGLIGNNNIIKNLINYGICGIEVYYPEHTKNQTNYYKTLAEHNRLLITGGSDCHGPKNKDGLRLGQIRLNYSYLKELKKYKEYANDNNIKKDLLS